jgi:hypothetical protein
VPVKVNEFSYNEEVYGIRYPKGCRHSNPTLYKEYPMLIEPHPHLKSKSQIRKTDIASASRIE